MQKKNKIPANLKRVWDWNSAIKASTAKLGIKRNIVRRTTSNINTNKTIKRQKTFVLVLV